MRIAFETATVFGSLVVSAGLLGGLGVLVALGVGLAIAGLTGLVTYLEEVRGEQPQPGIYGASIVEEVRSAAEADEGR
jgi:hypothetical protein